MVNTKACRLGMLIEEHFGQKGQNLLRTEEADDETMIQLIQAGTGLGVMARDEAEAAEKYVGPPSGVAKPLLWICSLPILKPGAMTPSRGHAPGA